MKRLGLIQPGKIGDIIICLPIAKYYYNLGYKVIWPIAQHYFPHFKDIAPYVEFIAIDILDCNLARQACYELHCNTTIDLSFNLPGSWDRHNSKFFKENEITFDALKYQIANVPFDEKWKLNLQRNLDREQEFYKRLNPTEEPYIVVQWQGSDCYKKVSIDTEYKLIEVPTATECIFDIIATLEKAKGFVLIDSCIANLVNQLQLPQPKMLITRSSKTCTPILAPDWKII